MIFKKALSWLWVLFAFLLPWQTRWIINQPLINGYAWEYGTVSLYATEVLLLVLLAASAPDIVRRTRRLRAQKNFMALAAGCAALFLISAVSVLWAADQAVALRALLRLFETLALLLALASAAIETRTFLAAFILGMIPAGAWGLVGFFAQKTEASAVLGLAAHAPAVWGDAVVEVTSGRWLRAYGPFPHPNIFGGYLVVALAMLFCLGVTARSLESCRGATRQSRLGKLWPSIFLSALFSAALFLTFSRSAIIGAVFFAIGAFWATRKKSELRSRFKIILLGVMAALLPLIIVFLPLVGARVGGSGRLETRSFNERASSLKEAGQIFAASGGWGVGIGNYTVALRERHPQAPAHNLQPVHSVPALVAAELGWLGLAALILLAISFFRFRSFSLSSFSFLLAFLPAALFDHYLWSLYPGLVLWAVGLGLAAQFGKS